MNNFFYPIITSFFILGLCFLVAISFAVNYDGIYDEIIIMVGVAQFIWFVCIAPIVKLYSSDPLRDALKGDSE